MKTALKQHFERHEIFYRAIPTAVLMIITLIIILAWELATK
ncbi:hypothetical protein [Candidatus Pantoea multigeneris]|nr:hypothetical protein [Pantoea multigeneris]